MTILTALRSASRAVARELLFGPRKPKPTYRDRVRATAARLRHELAAKKDAALVRELERRRADEAAVEAVARALGVAGE